MVTYFKSEISPLIKRLKKSGLFNCFSIGDIRLTRGKGYYAYHIELNGAGKFKVRGIKGELQVKSLLSDGWATRTRVLSYRTTRVLDSAVEAVISSIGDMIQNLEQQSDSLRDLITRHEEVERERKASAIKTSAYALTQSGHGEDQPYATLATDVFENTDVFRDCKADDDALVRVVEQWRAFVKAGEHTLYSSRFIIFLALLRGARDLDDIAIEAVETWVARTEGIERMRALGFRAWAYWALGDIDGAMSAADRWLKHVQKHEFGLQEEKNERLRAAMLENAYYRAERVFINPSMEDSPVERDYIRCLVNDAPPSVDKLQRIIDQDTKGAIAIMIATSLDELVEGMKMCKAAAKHGARSHPDKKVFAEFYQLHEQRYKRRVKELAS